MSMLLLAVVILIFSSMLLLTICYIFSVDGVLFCHFRSAAAILPIFVWMLGVVQFVLNDPPKAKLSKFGGFCNFARKSFGSSFEHLFKVCLAILFPGSCCIF